MSSAVSSPLSISSDNKTVNTSVSVQTLSLEAIVRTKKYLALLEGIKKISKTEFHAHLGGAVSTEFLQTHCSPEEFNDLSQLLDKIKNGLDYLNVFAAFEMVGKVLNTNQRLEAAAYDFCKSQFQDNVIYSELRTGLKQLDGSFEDYLNAALNGLEKGMQVYPIKVDLVLSLRRDTSIEEAEETIRLAQKYRARGIVGIDVSGVSTIGDGSGIFGALKKATELGFPITLHIGESPDETAEQQRKELDEIRPARIGHAVHLSDYALSWIKENNIPVEACVKSASLCKMIANPADHPALRLLGHENPVIFGSDDSTLFGSLSEELALMAFICDLSIEQVVERQQTSLNYTLRSTRQKH